MPGEDRAGTRSWWRATHLGEAVVIAVAGLVATIAIAHTLQAGAVYTRGAFAFGALIAVGELLRLALPGDRETAPIASAGALAYALLTAVGNEPASHTALQVVAVTAAGMMVGAMPHLAAGRPAGASGMAARLISVALVALVFRTLEDAHVFRGALTSRVAVMAGLLAVAWCVECLIRGLIRAGSLGSRFRVTLWDEMRVQWPLGVAVAASAMLIAFAAEEMGLVALAVFIAPLLVTQVAFRRYAGIRATYLQTVRALARVTEVGGYVEDGHAHRVGQLAVAVGRELGMNEPDLLELEYAALMHDIGQLSLRDPIPGGATVLASTADQHRIAELGAGVIGQAGVLDRVAQIVRCQGSPWRGAEGEPPLASRIIRATNDFDDLVGTSADVGRVVAVLERLRLDTTTEYDPAVVEALAKVAARRHTRHR